MNKALGSIVILVAVLAVGIGAAGAHRSKIRTRVIGAESTTGHFYDGGRPVGDYTTVQGFVRSKRLRCKRGRTVVATLLDTRTGDRKRLQPATSEPDGKFGVDSFAYTPKYDKAIITVRKRTLKRTASHRHVCRTKRVTVPHQDLG